MIALLQLQTYAANSIYAIEHKEPAECPGVKSAV